MMSIILAKTDYIISNNKTLLNLKEFNESFKTEAKVIWKAKCMLIKEDDLNDYYADGYYVKVYRTNNGYSLNYKGKYIELDVYDKQIIDYRIH